MNLSISRIAIRRPSSLSIGDWVFGPLIYLCGLGILALMIYLGYVLAKEAKPAFDVFGFGFLTDETWDPPRNLFGGLAPIAGTIFSSLLALIFAVPIGIGTAIFLAE